jgi:hypothetical protein
MSSTLVVLSEALSYFLLISLQKGILRNGKIENVSCLLS